MTLPRRLRLAWASRFAIDAPYQHNGIGRILARAIKTAARDYRLPPAERIEVIRTVPKSRARAIAAGDAEDFLTAAGFDVLECKYTSPPWQPQPETGHVRPPECTSERPVYNKLYYYVEL